MKFLEWKSNFHSRTCFDEMRPFIGMVSCVIFEITDEFWIFWRKCI
jgi:hypothetical protein